MVKRVFTVVHRGVHASAGQRERSAGVCREIRVGCRQTIRLHCACALSLSPHFQFCRMSQSLGQKNRSPAHRGCAFLLHLSVTPNRDPISFECLSSRAHFSRLVSNVSAPACPVHRISSACASILPSPQPWPEYAVPVRQFCAPPSASICLECLSSRAHF